MRKKKKEYAKGANSLFGGADYGEEIYATQAREEQMNKFGFQDMEKTSEYVETQWYKDQYASKTVGRVEERFAPKEFYADYLQSLLDG